MNPSPSIKSRAGFSLIEVLVATTILIVIVMMVSMVFQQSIGSWSSGTRRAESQMVLRTILGSIQRDLANAIPDDGNEWEDKKIVFFAVYGMPATTSDGKLTNAFVNIEYNFSSPFITRTVTPYVDGVEQGSRSETLNPGFKLKDFSFHVPPKKDWGERDDFGEKRGLPPRVDVMIEVETSGSEGIVRAHSRGPDGIDGTKDDIYVGGRP